MGLYPMLINISNEVGFYKSQTVNASVMEQVSTTLISNTLTQSHKREGKFVLCFTIYHTM